MKKFFLTGLAVSALFFTACSDDDDNTPDNNDDGVVTEIYDTNGNWTEETLSFFMDNATMNANATGANEDAFAWTVSEGGTTLNTDMTGAASIPNNITEDLTLTEAKYEISGAVFVRSGATLTIPAGTWFYSDPTNNADNANSSEDVLIIEQGATLVAEGTESNPIVFTSTVEQSGSWGGIVLLGNAPINQAGGTAVSEVSDDAGEDLTYGGSDSADSSGSLEYVILAYPGTQINSDSEYNGFSFYGLGTGTTLENLEVYQGQDDGFEWYGGTVNATNLYSNAYDDSLDWTDGWNGTVNNIVANQPEGADFCIEADNLSDDHNATPRSNPTITNATFYSDGSSDSAILLRRGTSIQLTNARFVIENTNVIPNINIDDVTTAELLLSGDTTLEELNFDAENPEFGGNANL